MELTEDEKAEITKILRRKGRYAWKPPAIEAVIAHIEAIRFGNAAQFLDDQISPHLRLSWREYFQELLLDKFLVDSG